MPNLNALLVICLLGLVVECSFNVYNIYFSFLIYSSRKRRSSETDPDGEPMEGDWTDVETRVKNSLVSTSLMCTLTLKQDTLVMQELANTETAF